MTDTPRLRSRVPWQRLALLVVVVVLTFANAAANLLPFHLPSVHERQLAEQQEIIAAREARIEELLRQPDRCRPAFAHELARALVFDGRSARDYAADYERRCGADPVMRHWGEAPVPVRYHFVRLVMR
jgi:hypothetical protein